MNALMTTTNRWDSFIAVILFEGRDKFAHCCEKIQIALSFLFTEKLDNKLYALWLIQQCSIKGKEVSVLDAYFIFRAKKSVEREIRSRNDSTGENDDNIHAWI